MPKQNLSKMSAEELEGLSFQLDEEIKAVRQRKLEVQEALSARNEADAAARRIETLSDTERTALFQVLDAQGIESVNNLS